MTVYPCDVCGRTIPSNRHHYLLTGDRTACGGCVDRADLYDDVRGLCTRAAVAMLRHVMDPAGAR